MNLQNDLNSKFETSSGNYFTSRYNYDGLELFPPDNHISCNHYFNLCVKGKSKLEDLELIFTRNNSMFVEFSKYNALVAKGTIIDSNTFKYDVITFYKNGNVNPIKIKNKLFHRNSNLVTYITHEFINNNNKLFIYLLEFILKDVDIKIVSRDKLDLMIITNNYKK